MKTLCFEIDFQKLRLDKIMLAEIEALGQANLFDNYLMRALDMKNGQKGIKPSDGRILRRIQDKLDASTDGTLSLEEAEFDLIKAAFRNEESHWPALQNRALMQYLDNIEAAEKESAGKA
jgi:hypothetical protein